MPDETITLSAVGDIMVARKDYQQTFQKVSSIFQSTRSSMPARALAIPWREPAVVGQCLTNNTAPASRRTVVKSSGPGISVGFSGPCQSY